MKTMNVKSFAAALALFAISEQALSQTSIQLKNNDNAAVLAPNQVISVSVAPETNAKVTIDVKNTSNSTKSYIAKRYDVILNADATATAQAYFCIAGSCYGPPTLISPTPLTLTPQQSASELQGMYQMLVADLDEISVAGYSHVKYTFQNTDNAADSVQISIKYNAPTVATGIASQSENKLLLEVGPVPAKEFVTLRTTEEMVDANVMILNSLGKVIRKQSLSQGNSKEEIKIDVSGIDGGIYYLVLSSQGRSVTKKLVID